MFNVIINGHAGCQWLVYCNVPLWAHTKAALSEECRLHFWTKAVHNFVTNAVVRIKQITSRSISQKPVQQNDKTLATRVFVSCIRQEELQQISVSLFGPLQPHGDLRTRSGAAVPVPCKVSTGRWILSVWRPPTPPFLSLSLPLCLFRTTRRLSVQGHTCKVQTPRRAYLSGLSCCTQKAIIPPRR